MKAAPLTRGGHCEEQAHTGFDPVDTLELEKGREGRSREQRGATGRGESQPRLAGHTHEWLGVGDTREDEIMNGHPRMSNEDY